MQTFMSKRILFLATFFIAVLVQAMAQAAPAVADKSRGYALTPHHFDHSASHKSTNHHKNSHALALLCPIFTTFG